jgi:hypothetical protein
MNLLEKWVVGTIYSDSQVLEILQDYGIISDNCYKLEQVANSEEAVNYLINKLGL